MNIYHISWTAFNSYGLNAVVIAADENKALAELDLDPDWASSVKIERVGITTESTWKTSVLAWEGL